VEKETFLDSRGLGGVDDRAGVLMPDGGVVPSIDEALDSFVEEREILGERRSVGRVGAELAVGMGTGSDISSICCWNARSSGERPRKEIERLPNRCSARTTIEHDCQHNSGGFVYSKPLQDVIKGAGVIDGWAT
jgi:hypothetical protein